VRLNTTIIDINKVETEINARRKYDKLKMRLCMIESKIRLSITVTVNISLQMLIMLYKLNFQKQT
jgi:hypothetical protein